MHLPSDHLLTEISVNHGEHKQVTLPDGTVVHLNAGTVMRYPTEFTSDIVGRNGRRSFFNVMRDEGKPFIVRTRQADVKVLGTSFNVKAYQEDELIAVSVRTGKVEVDMPESVMRLLPNEQVIVNNANGEILKKNEDAQKVTAWLQGGLYSTEHLSVALYTIWSGCIIKRSYSIRMSYSTITSMASTTIKVWKPY